MVLWVLRMTWRKSDRDERKMMHLGTFAARMENGDHRNHLVRIMTIHRHTNYNKACKSTRQATAAGLHWEYDEEISESGTRTPNFAGEE